MGKRTLLDNNTDGICKWSWKWRKGQVSITEVSHAQFVLINRVVVYTRFMQNVHWLLKVWDEAFLAC